MRNDWKKIAVSGPGLEIARRIAEELSWPSGS